MISLFFSIVPRSFLFPVMILAGTVVFYEGVPGAHYVPFVGPYLSGRVGHAYLHGRAVERAAWEDHRRRDLALAADRLTQAQAQIDRMDSDYWKSQTDQAIKIADLEKALEQEQKDNEKDAPGFCRPLLSRRLRDAISAVGD
jgi:hypothetical protein